MATPGIAEGRLLVRIRVEAAPVGCSNTVRPSLFVISTDILI